MRLVLIIFLVGYAFAHATGQDTNNCYGGTIVLEGSYSEEDLYVMNPDLIVEGGNGAYEKFPCTCQVLVNDEQVEVNHSANAYSIPLKTMGFASGEKIAIRIEHREGCLPRVLNTHSGSKNRFLHDPEDLAQQGDSVLSWRAKGGSDLLFEVEFKRWNKWVTQGKVPMRPEPVWSTYQCPIEPHSGKNEVRIRVVNEHGEPRFSETLEWHSNVEANSCAISSGEQQFFLLTPGYLELYNAEGQCLLKGEHQLIKFIEYPPGRYWVNFDNATIALKKTNKRLKYK